MPHRLKTILPVPDGIAARWFVLVNSLRNSFKKNSGSNSVFLDTPTLDDRYLYLLAEFFIQAGYFVHVCGGIRKEHYYNKDGYFFYTLRSDKIKYQRKMDVGISSGALLCTERESTDGAEAAFSKIIHLSYDIDVAPADAGQVVFFPYPMHPNVYRTGQLDRIAGLRDRPKRMGVFFAGNLKDQYAQSSRLLRRMITRFDAIQGIQRRFAGRVRLFATREALLRALEEEDLSSSIVVFDATTARLSREEWFPVLAQSRFFLALPGVVMPMCHNSVEAMALGVVPIIGYGHLFTPPLEPGTACLHYDSETDLEAAIEAALAMDAGAYAGLRQRAMDHYDRHMVPAAFLERLLRGGGKRIDVRLPAEFVSEKVACDNAAAS